MVDIFNRIVPWIRKNFWAKNDNIFMGQDTYIATDKVRARDSDGLLLVDDSDTEGLKVEDGGAISLTGNWRLKSETEGGVERLTLTSVGANSAAEFFLHPTGSANTSRLTITDSTNSVNYEGIEIEATASANRIGSIAAGTGTVQGLQFQISNSTKMTLTTAGNLGIGTTSPQEPLHVVGSGSSIRAEVEATDSNSAILKLTNTAGSFGVLTNADSLQFYDYTDAAIRVTMDGNGNVCIGTTGPNEKLTVDGAVSIVDGMTAPSSTSGWAKIYVDSADGDLKVKFGNGVIKTIATDT